MVARALEEDRCVEAEPAQRCVDAVRQAGQRVAQDAAVARVVHGVAADVQLSVVVQVEELQVACLPAAGDAVVDVAHVHLRHVFLRFFRGLEQSVGDEAPDFTQAHPFIVVLGERLILVVVLGDVALVVAHVEADAVLHGAAGQLELVAPAHGDFVTFRLQVGRVHVGHAGSVDSRQLDAVGQHVQCVSYVSVDGDVQTVLQHG